MVEPRQHTGTGTDGVDAADTVSGAATNPWAQFAVRRARRLVVSLWVLVTASFLMIHLIPGDPVRASLGPLAPAELVAARREALGLNEPLWRQYGDYLRNLVTGEWGESFVTRTPVVQIIADRLPATLEIAIYAFVVTMVVSVPLGVVMAALTRGGRRRRTELAFASSTVVVGGIPPYVMLVGLVYVFGVNLGWLPVAGRGGVDSFVLPVAALAIGPIAYIARIMRVEMLAVVQADYIRTARAKRLPSWRVYLRHALPNAATATLTTSGLLLGGLVVGTVLVENVSAWPGLGSTMLSSILSKDFPVVQGIVLVYGSLILVINLVIDVILALLDPRSTIRES